MAYSDVRSLPIRYRKWFLTRLKDEFEKNSEASKKRKNSRGETVQDIPMGEMSDIINRMALDHGPKKF
tara:strand:+ start:629 stop:832 length:204 start_codon:yes stop_codon:yes gene_type:complete